MSKYRDRLNSRKGLPPSLPKLTEGGLVVSDASGSFVSDPYGRFKNPHVPEGMKISERPPHRLTKLTEDPKTDQTPPFVSSVSYPCGHSEKMHISENTEICRESPSAYPLEPDTRAPFMPWCASISTIEFSRRRAELVSMIERIADIEGWPRQDLDDVVSRAINGPISDLLPNWHHFTERLANPHISHEKRGAP